MSSIKELYLFIIIRAVISGIELAGIASLASFAVFHNGLKPQEIIIAGLLLGYAIQLMLLIIYGSKLQSIELIDTKWKEIKLNVQWVPSEFVTLIMIGTIFAFMTLFILFISGATRLQGSINILVGIIMLPFLYSKMEEISYMMDAHNLVHSMRTTGIPFSVKGVFKNKANINANQD